MQMYSSYIEVGIVVIVTLVILSIITFIRKRRRQSAVYKDNISRLKGIDTVYIDDNEHIKLTGFKPGRRIKSTEYNLIIKYFQAYQLLIEEVRGIKSSDMINLTKIEQVKSSIHKYNAQLKAIENQIDNVVHDRDFLDLKSQLRKMTSPFYKRVLRRIMEFENLQLKVNELMKNRDKNHHEIEKLREEQRSKYKEYSQHKLDYFEERKAIYKKLVYRISGKIRIE